METTTQWWIRSLRSGSVRVRLPQLGTDSYSHVIVAILVKMIKVVTIPGNQRITVGIEGNAIVKGFTIVSFDSKGASSETVARSFPGVRTETGAI